MRSACVVPYMAVVCVCFSAVVAAAEQANFENATAATGQQYVQLRDQLLSAGFSRNDMAAAARSNDWRKRGTALVLMGWKEYGDKYARLVSDEKVRDLRGRERYVWSTDPEQVDVTLLPLAYEFLLKNTEGAAGREAAARMIPYLLKEDNARDMKVLAGAIYDPDVDQQTRVTVARIIANTPGEIFHVADLRKMIEAEVQRNQADRDVVDWLLNGLVARSGKADEASKREITSWLAQADDVSQLVGRRRVVHALGSLGADNAAPLVAEFLNRTESVTDQRWAIRSLSMMGTSEASNAIIRILTSQTTDPSIRMIAASSLGKVEYSVAVKNVLDEVMRDERLDPNVRRAAHGALQQQLEASRDNAQRVREIRDVLRGVDPGAFQKIPGLRDERDGGDPGPRQSRQGSQS